MPCERASKPLAAVCLGGSDTILEASKINASGINLGSSKLIFFPLSIKTAYFVTSLPVPAVVGIAVWGIFNFKATYLPQSIVEPPPIEITSVYFSPITDSTNFVTNSNVGLGGICVLFSINFFIYFYDFKWDILFKKTKVGWLPTATLVAVIIQNYNL